MNCRQEATRQNTREAADGQQHRLWCGYVRDMEQFQIQLLMSDCRSKTLGLNHDALEGVASYRAQLSSIFLLCFPASLWERPRSFCLAPGLSLSLLILWHTSQCSYPPPPPRHVLPPKWGCQGVYPSAAEGLPPQSGTTSSAEPTVSSLGSVIWNLSLKQQKHGIKSGVFSSVFKTWSSE